MWNKNRCWNRNCTEETCSWMMCWTPSTPKESTFPPKGRNEKLKKMLKSAVVWQCMMAWRHDSNLGSKKHRQIESTGTTITQRDTELDQENGLIMALVTLVLTGPGFDFQMCFAPQRRALFPQFNFQKSSEHDILRHLLIEHVLRATTGVYFFHISTSKRGPRMVCFDTFDFKMCFAPQRRAIFRFSSAQMSPHPPL